MRAQMYNFFFLLLAQDLLLSFACTKERSKEKCRQIEGKVFRFEESVAICHWESKISHDPIPQGCCYVLFEESEGAAFSPGLFKIIDSAGKRKRGAWKFF